MKANSYTQAPLVIENPSKGLLAFVDKMRERKLAQLEELRDKRDYSIKIIV